MNKLNLFFTVILLFFVVSCSEDSIDSFKNFTVEEIKQSSDLDLELDFVEELELQIFDNQNSRNSQLPDCATVTVIMQQNYKEITVDFGDGCEVNGKFLSGIMVITFEPNPSAAQLEITTVFDNFGINQKTVNGTKSKLREASNNNGNPQHTISVDINVSWENGTSVDRYGTRIRERVQGQPGVWPTYIFEITGTWTNDFSNGESFSYEILTPVVKKTICYFFVAGNVLIDKPSISGVLDYGNGQCDNNAIFTTSDGEVIEISLN